MPTHRVATIDLAGAKDPEDVHVRIVEALGFPDYYGRNWDAFDECVRDMESPPSKIRFLGLRETPCVEAKRSRSARSLLSRLPQIEQRPRSRNRLLMKKKPNRHRQRPRAPLPIVPELNRLG